MRILQVDKFLRRVGGAACYMLDVSELLRRRGHTVEHFAMAHPANQPAAYEAYFPPQVVLDEPGGRLAERLHTAASMIHSGAARRGMSQVLDAFAPDVVHLHNIYHQLSPSILGPIAARRIPIVMTVHDFKLVCPSYRLLDGRGPCEACVSPGAFAFRPAAARRCKDGSLAASGLLALEASVHRWVGAYDPIELFLAPSEFLAERLRRGGIASQRVRRLANFVELDRAPVRQGPGAGVVFVGRLSPEKGIDVLIRAVGLAPRLRLRIAGDGPDRAALERLAGEVAPGRVEFLGLLPRAEVDALVQGARTAALPARWHENMPLSVIEAMAAGVPQVVTGLGGLPELVTDGVEGLVAPVDDPAALAAALTRLEEDTALAEAMGAAARRTATQRWGAEAHLLALETAYADAASRCTQRSAHRRR
ncbi:MAG: glycosyltransferase [Acidimicrobiales bacterium]